MQSAWGFYPLLLLTFFAESGECVSALHARNLILKKIAFLDLCEIICLQLSYYYQKGARKVLAPVASRQFQG